jgi:hypothetical protein
MCKAGCPIRPILGNNNSSRSCVSYLLVMAFRFGFRSVVCLFVLMPFHVWFLDTITLGPFIWPLYITLYAPVVVSVYTFSCMGDVRKSGRMYGRSRLCKQLRYLMVILFLAFHSRSIGLLTFNYVSHCRTLSARNVRKHHIRQRSRQWPSFSYRISYHSPGRKIWDAHLDFRGD